MTNVTPRIVFVIGQLSYGGAEHQITLLAKEISIRGNFVPVVISLSDNIFPYGESLSDSNIEWYSAPKTIKNPLRKLYWLLKLVKNLQCDLIYGFLHVGNIYAGFVSQLLHLPFVASIRNVDRSLPNYIKQLSKYFCNHADMVVGNSESCLESLARDLQVFHDRKIVIPNIVDQIQLSPEKSLLMRQKWRFPNFVVGTIALLKRQKRPDLFINVFRNVIKNNENIHFVWVGDGPEYYFLESELAQMPPSSKSQFHLEGFQNDIGAYLSTFDVFLLLSDYEGLPNALLEAMAVGLPCVVTKVPGIVDIFANQDPNHPIGLLSDPNDPEQIAEILMDLLSQPDLRRNLGDNAKSHIQKQYSSQDIVDAYSLLFNCVIMQK